MKQPLEFWKKNIQTGGKANAKVLRLESVGRLEGGKKPQNVNVADVAEGEGRWCWTSSQGPSPAVLYAWSESLAERWQYSGYCVNGEDREQKSVYEQCVDSLE